MVRSVKLQSAIPARTFEQKHDSSLSLRHGMKGPHI